jgi:uncharacterized membrane protein YfcA
MSARLWPALLAAALAVAAACGDARAQAVTGASRDGNVSVGPQVFAGDGGVAPPVTAHRDEALTERETVLGGTLALIALLGAASFLLSGRVEKRVHVALALLTLLVAVFGLYVLLGTSSALGAPLVSVVALVALLVVLKLMGRFETTLDRPR